MKADIVDDDNLTIKEDIENIDAGFVVDERMVEEFGVNFVGDRDLKMGEVFIILVVEVGQSKD